MPFIDDYANYDAIGLAELIRTRRVKAEEVIEAAVQTIQRINGPLNAVVAMRVDAALAEARNVNAGPLAGVPIVMKDEYQFCDGLPTSSASRLAQGMTLPYDTEIVRRYKRAGIIVLAKTNLPEFGASVATEPVLNGVCRNPWNPELGVGGSSGGSGCAVAAGMVPFAYANDGAGSIRIPASANGVFGLKPTRARVPCGPEVSELWNGLVIEHAVTRTVRDSAALLDATAGADAGAPYWAPPPQRPFLAEVGSPTGKLRIALCTRPFLDVPVHAECVRAAQNTAQLCSDMGHEVIEAAPPFEGAAIADAIGKLLAIHLGAGITELEAQTGRKASLDNVETANWKLAQWGNTLPASALLEILALFSRQSRRCTPFFEKYDLLLTPTLATPPPPHGSISANAQDEQEYLRRFFAFVPFTPIANVLGNPAMSVPLHWTPENVPVGVHFVARFGDEALLFRLASAFEEARPWRNCHPPLGAWRS